MANVPDTSTKPYRIAVQQSKIDRLKQKLELADFPDELDNSGWDYGTPLAEVKRLVKAWKNFDWRAAEKKLNDELPQFETPISVDGFGEIPIHFVYKTSNVKTAIPLLFVHGWPGSFEEVRKILPKLADEGNGDVAFHVVAPSLPNYGFSGGVSKKGFALEQYAETCHKLMQKLGYKEYVTQGGDWGFYITRTIGMKYPDHCKASHINMVRADPPSFFKNPLLAAQHAISPYSDWEKEAFERGKWFAKEGRGYSAEQGTKPQTIGYALTDSPVALLAWIYEKLHDWTDSYPWTDEEILTWISIYAFARAGPAASVRIYYEALHNPEGTVGREDVKKFVPRVKYGLSFFPYELDVSAISWGRTLGDVVFEHVNEHGGHFAAWEQPDVIVKDLQKMFGRGGGAYGVVQGKDGMRR